MFRSMLVLTPVLLLLLSVKDMSAQNLAVDPSSQPTQVLPEPLLQVFSLTERLQPAPKVKGIDPAVVSLKVAVKKKVSDFQAEIEIVGVIKNIGSKDFISRKGQQSAQLYENVPGVKPKVVVTHDFTTLKAGQQFAVQYKRKWSTSMEFPPSYRLQIDYDPDIFIDGNPKNDDKNQKNNSRELKGTTINDYVRNMLGK